MKNILLVIFSLFFNMNAFSQISFESGYYIDNSGNRVECYIKNVDWKNNPTKFDFKLFEKSEHSTLNINNIQEFGIDSVFKFIRRNVSIDRSSDNIGNLSENKESELKREVLFLKVLVEGKANLYSYVDNGLTIYLYNHENNSNISQLIYKRFITEDDKIAKNNKFRQQLLDEFNCASIDFMRIESLEYKKSDLVSFFVEYNKCHNSNLVNFHAKETKGIYSLLIRPRLNSSSLSIENSVSTYKNINFDNEFGFGLGLEAEYVFPFNKHKWAVVVEPTYQYYSSKKSEDSNSVSGGKLVAEVDYSSIEIPLTLRHYFFLNKNSKLFLNASYVFDLNLNSEFKFLREDGSVLSTHEIRSRRNFAFGLGLRQNDKYVVELRYQINRNLFSDYINLDSNYSTLSLILGYSIL